MNGLGARRLRGEVWGACLSVCPFVHLSGGTSSIPAARAGAHGAELYLAKQRESLTGRRRRCPGSRSPGTRAPWAAAGEARFLHSPPNIKPLEGKVHLWAKGLGAPNSAWLPTLCSLRKGLCPGAPACRAGLLATGWARLSKAAERCSGLLETVSPLCLLSQGAISCRKLAGEV